MITAYTAPSRSDADRSPLWAIVLLAFVVGAGTWLRLWNLGRHSLWLDEAWLANSLLCDSLHDVVFRGPGSAAPNSTPFLLSIATHYLTRILGDSEFVLRLLPALFSSGSILAVWLFARRLGASTFTALLAAILIAFNPVSIEYAKELKQYAGDTFWIPLFLVAVCRFVARPSWRFAALLAFGTLIAFGFAQTIALALPGACLYMALCAIRKRGSDEADERPRACLIRSAAVMGVWVVGTGLIYLLVIRQQSSERLVAFWDEFFPANAAPGPLARYAGYHILGFFNWFFEWFGQAMPNAESDNGAPVIPWIKLLLALAAIGAIGLAVRRPAQFLMLVLMPGIVALALSTKRMFPFGAVRVNLFMLPFVVLLVAFGFDAIGAASRRLLGTARRPHEDGTGKRGRFLPGLLSPACLVALAVALAIPRIDKERHSPKGREETRSLFEALLDGLQDDDAVVLLDTHVRHAMTYYTRNRSIDYETFKSKWSDSVLSKSFTNTASRSRRVWIVGAHFNNRQRIDEILAEVASRFPNLAIIDHRDALLAFFEGQSSFEQLPPSAFEFHVPNGEDRAALALDGDPETHWMTTAPRTPGWQIEIDLATPQPLSAVVLNTKPWPDDWSHELYAQTKTTTSDVWTSAGVSVWEGPRTTIRFDDIDAPIRSVRLTNAQADPKFHWSIHELEVWKRVVGNAAK